ncbi:MAG: FtsW/RodA/SpoVE family cell cycle protein [Christensenellales bacterium]
MKLKIIDPRMFRFIDWFLFGIIIILALFSLVAIASAQSEPLAEGTESISEVISQLNLYHVFQQLAWLGVGLFAMFIVLIPDYHAIGEYYKWMYVIIVGLLVLVLLFGRDVKGTVGWFRIGNSGFQPSELGKVAIIIILARMISDKTRGKEGGIKKIKDILPILIVFLIPVALIILQPDYGAVMVYIFIFFSMLFIARTSIKLILAMIASAGCLAPLLLLSWQKTRIDIFLYTFLGIIPEGTTLEEINRSAFQSLQAQTAVGAGQITGRGLFSMGGVGQLTNIPEKHTDFIFASTAESIGFLGSILLTLLFFILLFRTMHLATKAKDEFGTLIIFGVFAMTLFHVFENIAMNIGVMPITGITLPFFSYGGSSLLTNMIAYGLVINVNMRRQNWGTSKLMGSRMYGKLGRGYY